MPPGTEPTRAHARRARIGSAAGLAALFVATLVSTSLALRALLDRAAPLAVFEPGSVEEKKAAAFLEQAHELDLVFVGTSRSYRAIDPSTVDRLLATEDRAPRCFNFALPGSRQLESLRIVDWILAHRGPRLRWVAFELTGEVVRHRDGWVHEENALTRRAIEWRTPELTRIAWRGLLRSGAGPAVLLDGAREHARHGALRLFSVGLGSTALRNVLLPRELPRDWNGFQALRDDATMRRTQRKAAEGEPWSELAAAEAANLDRSAPPAPELLATLDALFERTERASVELVFLGVPPSLRPEVAMFTEDAPGPLGDLGHLLDYGDPLRFPELYEAQHYYNRFHLNGRGAQILSRHLAHGLRDLLEVEQQGSVEPDRLSPRD